MSGVGGITPVNLTLNAFYGLGLVVGDSLKGSNPPLRDATDIQVLGLVATAPLILSLGLSATGNSSWDRVAKRVGFLSCRQKFFFRSILKGKSERSMRFVLVCPSTIRIILNQ